MRLPREVLESELFGHEKGAFTGAVGSKPGLIELADGGTLFLDEIGDMEPDSQVKLLRVLETGMFFRVGGTRPRRVDVRLVAATNRDLAVAMKTGQFREDLYYRINTITVNLPPLRDRPEDVTLLAQHFLETNAHLRSQAAEPGGAGRVRGLRVARQRARAAARDPAWGHPLQGRRDHTGRTCLPEVAGGAAATPAAPGSAGGGNTLETMERQHIIGTLRQVRRSPRQGRGPARHRSQDALPEDPQLPDHARASSPERVLTECLTRPGRSARSPWSSRPHVLVSFRILALRRVWHRRCSVLLGSVRNDIR